MGEHISRRNFLSRSAVVGGTAVLGGAAATGLAGCSSNSSTTPTTGAAHTNAGVGTGTPVRGGSLTVAVTSDISGFYPPNSNFDWTGKTYANTIYDLLVVVGNDGSYQPYLCQSITPNATADTWTMVLRPGVTFHDGSALTADVVVANFEVLKASFLTSKALTQVASASASDANTVVYTLTGPDPNFPYTLTTQVGYVVGQAMIDAEKAGVSSTKPIGTGPFVFSEWLPNQHFIATRNPSYWRQGLPYLDQVKYLPIPDSSQRAASLKSGSVDMIVTNDPKTPATFASNPSYQLVDTTQSVVGEPNITFICLNTAVAPTNDLSIRKALAMATDQAAVQKVFGAGMVEPLNGVFPPGSPYYTETGYPTYDLAAATKLVDAYKAAHGTPVIDLTTITDPRLAVLVQLLQQMWSQAGFQVTISTVEQAILTTQLTTGKFQAITATQFGAAVPDANYQWWSTTTTAPVGQLALNFTRNSDPLIEAAMLQARATTDRATRVAAWQTVDKRLAADLPYIWIQKSYFGVAANTTTQNFANFVLPSGSKGEAFNEGVFYPTEIWIKA